MGASPNIVLVHGAWADGSCWSEVVQHLQADGYVRLSEALAEVERVLAGK